MFKDMKFYFHPAKLSKNRLKLFCTQVSNNQAKVVQSSDLATHVIVEESCDYLALPTSLWSNGATVAGSLWLSQCLKKNVIVDTGQFIIEKPIQKRPSHSPDRTSVEPIKSNPSNSPSSHNNKKYSCSQASNRNNTSCNEIVVDQLKKLAETYRARGDQWRAHGYEKAISAIRRCDREITTFEEVAALEGVGSKMATKVMEVISTGKLRKVEELCGSEQSKVMDLFSNIWGAGPAAVNAWYIKGHRTLSDLIQNESLTKQQKIGIKYYSEFMEKMSRSEVEEIWQKVTDATLQIDESLTTMLCGSYRRGKTYCGDVDVVVIKPDAVNSKDILLSILNILKGSGFITDDLVGLEKSGNQRKYLGVCQLPGDGKIHRRLDIFVVPQSESACAIMHYTGSALFNRSIRQLAADKGMYLSEHSLSAGVVRKGMEILSEGHILPTPTEESIFTHLGLEYRPPEERDH